MGILKTVLYQWRYRELTDLYMQVFNKSQSIEEAKEELETASLLIHKAANRMKEIAEEKKTK